MHEPTKNQPLTTLTMASFRAGDIDEREKRRNKRRRKNRECKKAETNGNNDSNGMECNELICLSGRAQS